MTALQPLSGLLMQNYPGPSHLSVLSQSISSKTYTVPALRLTQRADKDAGFTLRAGVGRREYLAGNKMNRKLITGLNNRLSVSPRGVPLLQMLLSKHWRRRGHGNQTKISGKDGPDPRAGGAVGRAGSPSGSCLLTDSADRQHL